MQTCGVRREAFPDYPDRHALSDCADVNTELPQHASAALHVVAGEQPDSSLVPFANAASMRTRCEMLLSPGGRTTPPTRRTLLIRAADTSPPRGGAREPGREGGGVTHLERALDRT